MDLATRVSLAQNLLTIKKLPVSVVAELAGINCSSVYYSLSVPSDEELECNATIDAPNQVWPIDITYMPINCSFLYLTADIDWNSRWADNIMIGRWFCTFKYDEVYLAKWHNIREARVDIVAYVFKYNFERCYSSIGNFPRFRLLSGNAL